MPRFGKGTIPFAHGIDSRWVLLAIYRWYRTLSPRIDITIDSAGWLTPQSLTHNNVVICLAVFDQRSSQLFVNIHQTFALWFVPFYKAPVRLVTVLQLAQRASWDSNETVTRSHLTEGREPAALSGPGQERSKYYIVSQEDLYTFNDAISFVAPGFGPLLWSAWQLFSTVLCVLCSVLFLPIYLLLNKGTAKKNV